MRRLGVIGYIAKGLVIAGAGVLVIIAASVLQPDKATGLDGALNTRRSTLGAILLILTCVGIIIYGLLLLRHGPIRQNVADRPARVVAAKEAAVTLWPVLGQWFTSCGGWRRANHARSPRGPPTSDYRYMGQASR